MSQIVYSRGSLYEQYKNSDLEFAKKFLGENYSNYNLLVNGTILSGGSIAATIISFIIIGSTIGFGYPHAFEIISGVCGPLVVAGLVTLAIWYCKRRSILSEELTAGEINAIAGKILIHQETEL